MRSPYGRPYVGVLEPDKLGTCKWEIGYRRQVSGPRFSLSTLDSWYRDSITMAPTSRPCAPNRLRMECLPWRPAARAQGRNH